MRRIVLLGNCQVQAMGNLYQRYTAPRTGDRLHLIQTSQGLTEDDRIAIRQADLIVEQLFDDPPAATIFGEESAATRLFLPSVTGHFLWPFGGGQHPNNPRRPYMIEGPYGGETSDRFLNQLIRDGVAPDVAVETYETTDVPALVGLDALYQRTMQEQRTRDGIADIAVADLIEAHFRSERVFLCPHHPDLRLTMALARQLFRQMGAHADDIARMEDQTRVTPFPKNELPIHPSIARHYGLHFVTTNQRYRFLNEGTFTWREFALRYMRLEWNEDLEAGLDLLRANDTQAAQDRLEAALTQSPNAAQAHMGMSQVLLRQGRLAEALAQAQQAVALEPDNASCLAEVGNLHRLLRQHDEAERAFRMAIALDPTEAHYPGLLAHMLGPLGRTTEARALIDTALALEPHGAHLHGALAILLEAEGDATGAEAALRRAIELAPASGHYQQNLSQHLDRRGRMDEAIAAAREAAALEPNDPQRYAHLAHLLARAGDVTGAEVAYRAASALDPGNAGVRTALAELLGGAGRWEEAIVEAREAVAGDPDSVPALAMLATACREAGDLASAEAALRTVIRIDPANAHMYHQLSDLLTRQGNVPDAIAAARQAAEIDASNPHRMAHVGHLLFHNGDIAGAVEAFRTAADRAPFQVSFRLALGDALTRQGRLAEGVAEAREATLRDPNSAHAFHMLAHLSMLAGQFDRAEEALWQVFEREPRNEQLPELFERLGDARLTRRRAA